MNFLKEYGFEEVDINEFLENTPEKIKEAIKKHEKLVRVNIEYLKNLGVITYKEIFINYPDMFLMDASTFEKSFSQYETKELLEKLNINSSYFSNIENIALKKINTDYLVLVENKAWVFNINKKYNEMTCFDVDEEYKLHAILEKQNKEIQKNNEKILWTLENMQYIENEKEVQEMKNKYHDLLRAEFVVIASIFNK